MRTAVVIVPSLAKTSATRRVSPLGDMLADRLGEPDAGYRVEVLEARGRIGDRLTRVLEEHEDKKGPVLIVVSGEVAVDEDGGAALRLGGHRGGELPFEELRSILAAVTNEALLVVDAAHRADDEDPTISAGVVAAVRDAIGPKESGIELLIGARPLALRNGGPSPFLSALLAAFDACAPMLKKTGQVGASAAWDVIRADRQRFHAIAASGHFRGRADFPLLAQASIVVGSDSVAPPSRSSTRPGVPSIPPGAATPAVDEAWRAGNAASREGDHANAIEHYKRALLLLGPKPERAELYFRIGRAKEALGSGGEAVNNFDKALGVEPLHRDAFERASSILRASRDFAHLERLMRRRFEAQSDDKARVKELRGIVRLWREAGDIKRAVSVLEEWIAISEDAAALEELTGVLTELGRHAQANDARKRLCALIEDRPRRAKILSEAARVAQRELPAGGDAIELARKALEEDPKALEALEIAAGELGNRRKWSELAALYEWLLERVEDDFVGWDLAKKLGTLARDELDDLAAAKRAFSRAASKNPEDIELRFWIAELCEAERDYASAAAEMRAAAPYASETPEIFRRALWCFEKTGETDSAWNAACVLDELGEADINESLLADQHRPEGLIAAQGGFDEDDWLIFRADRDQPLEGLLELIAPAAIELRVKELQETGALPKLDAASLQNPTGTTMLARTLAWTSRLLGIDPPALHVIAEVEGGIVPIPLGESTLAAGRAVGGGLELGELSFLMARALAYLRPENRLVTYYPTRNDIAKLLLATLSIARVEGADAEGDVLSLKRGLKATISDELRKKLKKRARRFEQKRMRTRVGRLVRSVHASAARAALFAAGDIARAIDLSRRFPMPIEFGQSEQIADLRAFSIDPGYAALRAKIGVAIR